MATFALGAAGQAMFGPIGGFVGGIAGALIDRLLFAPDPIVSEGPRISDLARQADSPGAPIARVWGTQNRVAGTVISTSGLKETRHEEEIQGGKGSPEPAAVNVTYTYAVDLAVLVCKGPIVGIPRIWGGPKLIRDSGGDRGVADIRIALGTLTQQPDAMLEAAEGVGNVPAFRGNVVVYFQDIQLADFGNAVPPLSFEVDAGPATVQSIAADLFELAGLSASEYDVTNVTLEQVPGFALRRLASPREGLERLGAAYGFDVSDTGYQLKLRRRERSADLVLDEDDFGAAAPGAEATQPESHTRDSERELPREVVLTHGDPARDLQINAQRSDRLISDSVRELTVEFPGTLTAARARDALDDLIGDLWQQRYSFRATLPPKYLALDAGDIVTIRRAGESFWPRYLVTRSAIGADWRIEAEMRPTERRWALPAAPATSGSIAVQVVPLPNDSDLELMDLPLLTDSEPDANGLYAAVGDSGTPGNEWTGAVLYRSTDDAEYSAVARFDIEAALGTADEALPTGPFYWPDRRNTVRVTLTSGTLSSATESDWLHKADKNAALLGGELIQFRDATLISGTTWELSGLKRGRRGTEWARASHAIGERFVLLTRSTVKRVFLDLGLLNDSLFYKAVTFDQALADVTAETFAVTGEWAKPWAGLDAEGTRDGGDDLTVTWRRRGRQGGGTWVGEVPLGEATESYEIDVMDGATVKRTLTATAESVVYTAAQQTTDFGAPQSAVSVNIYQLSALVGRGRALNATI